MPNNKQQQHRERPDDDVERAPESGDPKETGRSRGKPVDEKDDRADDAKSDKGEHWESGRQRAT
jgi:hypothetical protein